MEEVVQMFNFSDKELRMHSHNKNSKIWYNPTEVQIIGKQLMNRYRFGTNVNNFLKNNFSCFRKFFFILAPWVRGTQGSYIYFCLTMKLLLELV